MPVFQDTEALTPGYQWREDIRTALDAAVALVCLWTTNRSDFVAYEIEQFMSRDRQDKRIRPVIMVLLDESPATPYDHLSMIVDERLRAAYRRGPEASSAKLFERHVKKIVGGLRKADGTFSIPVAPFALTRRELLELGGNLDAVRTALGLTQDQLNQRYGEARVEWKPFVDSDMTVADLLDHVEVRLDGVLPSNKKVYWSTPEDEFLEHGDEGRGMAYAFKAEMTRVGFGVIVIDPVALCSKTVGNRLAIFSDCVRSSGIAVIAIPTRRADERMRKLRSWLLDNAAAMFGHFEAAAGAEDPRARVELHIDDETDILRLVRYCVGTTVAHESGGESILRGSASR
jgi:hypothetical protein